MAPKRTPAHFGQVSTQAPHHLTYTSKTSTSSPRRIPHHFWCRTPRGRPMLRPLRTLAETPVLNPSSHPTKDSAQALLALLPWRNRNTTSGVSSPPRPQRLERHMYIDFSIHIAPSVLHQAKSKHHIWCLDSATAQRLENRHLDSSHIGIPIYTYVYVHTSTSRYIKHIHRNIHINTCTYIDFSKRKHIYQTTCYM
jgi:hypothetical protein